MYNKGKEPVPETIKVIATYCIITLKILGVIASSRFKYSDSLPYNIVVNVEMLVFRLIK